MTQNSYIDRSLAVGSKKLAYILFLCFQLLAIVIKPLENKRESLKKSCEGEDM